MPTTLPTQRGIDPAATTPMPTVDATPHLSARTLSRLAQRPQARLVVDSVWNALTELEQAGHHPRLLAARSANRSTGTKPAHDTMFGPSSIADTAAAL